MENDKNINLIVKNEDEEDENTVVISIKSFIKMLKRYLLIWIVLAVILGIIVICGCALTESNSNKKLNALVSFNYTGIEKGLDPAGNTFDVTTLKTPSVIEKALTELGQPLTELENIRQGISIEGVIPSDAMDKITTYKSVYESNTSAGALSAAQAMLDVSYYPTQYKVSFNYSATAYSSSEAVEVFNTILECYRDYFFETYGYNQALGSAVTALDYTDYDYAEALDVFDSSLSSLSKYVSQLAEDDTTRFRSNATGYTFSDLSEAIKTIRNMDLDILSSYITVNNVTRDKESLITYYNYRIDALTRSKTVSQEELNSITESINSYEKDTVLIFGNGTDGTDTTYSQASEEYDNLIKQKISTQSELSTTNQQINAYKARIESLNKKTSTSDASIEKVETDLANLKDKVDTLIQSINDTADEYYENVAFANAYSILVPSSSSAVSRMKSLINEAKIPVIIIEGLLFAIYIAFTFIKALVIENRVAEDKKVKPISEEVVTE